MPGVGCVAFVSKGSVAAVADRAVRRGERGVRGSARRDVLCGGELGEQGLRGERRGEVGALRRGHAVGERDEAAAGVGGEAVLVEPSHPADVGSGGDFELVAQQHGGRVSMTLT